jgi:hypothetical protein
MESHQLRRAYQNDPDSPEAQAYLRYKKYGAGSSGWHAMEMKKESRRVFEEFERAFADSKPTSTLDYVKHAAKYLGEKHGKATDFLSAWVDYNDDVFRFANYLGLERKYLAQGIAPEGAARMAAERINKYFWQAGHVGKHLNAARQAIGFVDPYITAKAEDMRITLNAGRGLLPGGGEDNAFRLRTLLWHGLWHGGAIAGVNALIGGSPQELEAARARVTKGQKFNRPMLEVTRLPPDEKGRWRAIDLGTYSPVAAYLRGHPDDPEWARVLMNMTLENLGMLSEVAKEPIYNSGLMTAPDEFKSVPRIYEEEGVMGVLAEMAKSAAQNSVIPGAVTKVWRTHDRMQNTKSPTAPDLPTAVMQNLGVPVQPVPATRQAVARERVFDNRDILKRKKQLNRERNQGNE